MLLYVVRQWLTYASRVPVTDWRLLLCGTLLGDDHPVSSQLNTISSEAAAPTAPATATASQGSACEAMTPARIMAAPWPSCIPAIASPNAWPRRSSGTAATKAAFAPTWYESHKPEASKITRIPASPGFSAAAVRMAQAPKAKGTVIRCRISGPTSMVKAVTPRAAPNAGAAMTTLAATGPPPAARANGTAMASGTVYAA